ncbi:type II toxin-antitoxin system PemK/MazF family toxin [Candidatus Poriferisodalis sp.]|uniref:type II toxin-antitoxin system PemK/MazF family toxin n=1 Tax=Candidatus Poriferisodalis sp. TaxID=3101277 RepID=UPI003D14E4E4
MASIDELWLADFGTPYPSEPSGRRPALVLGPPDFFGSEFPIAFVAPLTTTYRGLDLHVEVSANRPIADPQKISTRCGRGLRRCGRRRTRH